jgi:hypothetical protein
MSSAVVIDDFGPAHFQQSASAGKRDYPLACLGSEARLSAVAEAPRAGGLITVASLPPGGAMTAIASQQQHRVCFRRHNAGNTGIGVWDFG